ncbi:RM10 protein, partial [Donacobius atricapilla]|nr:RM10 protein [Donacobius atricapilla]
VPVPVPALSAAPAAWLPALQLLRRGSKAVTRHWKAMHFQRQKLLALTEYVPPRPAVPPRCLPRRAPEGLQVRRGLCGHRERVFLRDWTRGWHRAWLEPLENRPGGYPPRAVPVPHPELSPQIVRPVLAQSKYRNLLPLFVCQNILLVSPEARAREMLRVLKGVPQVNLLGACIDDTILSRQGVESFSRLPSLEVSQGQTVAALSLLSSQTSSLLQRGPAHLTALLDEHIRRLRGAGGATEPPQGRNAGNQ